MVTREMERSKILVGFRYNLLPNVLLPGVTACGQGQSPAPFCIPCKVPGTVIVRASVEFTKCFFVQISFDSCSNPQGLLKIKYLRSGGSN